MNKYILIGILIPLPIFVIGYLMMANNQQKSTPDPVKINIFNQQSSDSVNSEQSRTAQDKSIDSAQDKPASNNEQLDTNRDTITPMAKQNNNTQPSLDNFEKKIYTVTMTTTAGVIVLELDGKKTPVTVNNFITLAKKGFYDNVIFHRTIANFMIQGGDPTGTGTGGPGYKFDDEKFDGEYTRGTLAMANSGPNTNGSQFFIMHADVQLQKDYVIFGKVTSGIETVDKIATAPTGSSDRPIDPVKITKMQVE
jgi:cyclophilin family peptidyl-prolyl cis-trans isomerase